MTKFFSFFLVLGMLFIASPNQAKAAACPSPYDTFSSDCNPYTFSGLSNFYSLQAIDVDFGGGMHAQRINPSQLTTYGWDACYQFGSLDAECFGILTMNVVQALKTTVDGKFNAPSGTTSQYVRGDGSLATFPAAGTRTFQTPTRTVGTCFQISATKDAEFHYGVDAAILLSLGTSSVNVTSYTNSACTTGAIVETASSDNGIGLGVTRTMRMDGKIQGGRWVKITATTTGGVGSTMTLRTDQREIIEP